MKKIILILHFVSMGVLGITQSILHYTNQNTFPQVFDIQQDKNGFIWFSSNRGIIKYDGLEYLTFSVKEGLPNNNIERIEIDNQNRVWYLSKSSYQGYIKNDSVYKFTTVDSLVLDPTSIFFEEDKTWISTQNSFYTVKDGYLTETFKSPKTKQDLSKNINFSAVSENYKINLEDIIACNPNKKEFIVFKENSILLLNSDFKLSSEIKLTKKFFHHNSNSATIDWKMLPNYVYYYAIDKGVLFVDFKLKKSKYFTFEELTDNKNPENVRCNLNNGNLQISVPGHLIIFNSDFEIINQWPFHEAINNYQSYLDTDGNIWTADSGKSLSFFSYFQVIIKHYFTNEKYKNINSIGIIKNDIYVGIEDFGFYNFDPDSKVSTSLCVPEIKVKGKANAIQFNQASDIGYLLSGKESYIYKNDRLSPLKHLSDEEGLEGHKLIDVIELNSITFAITPNGLITIDLESHKIESIFKKDGLKDLAVFQNQLFVGSDDGLYIFRTDHLTKIITTRPILNAPINTLFSDTKSLIIGTVGNGIYYFENAKFTPILSTKGIIVNKIIKDGNSIMLATENGVKKVSINNQDLANSKIVDSFYEVDGLLDNSINDLLLVDTLLYVASKQGIARMPIYHPVYNKGLKLYFKSLKDTIELNHDQNSFTVSFSVLDFVNQDLLSYKYRLLPIQTDWNNTSTTSLNFNNLKPNFYTLEVQAMDHHNNTAIKQLYVNVIPAWWQKLWVKCVLFLLGAITLYVFYKIIQRQVQKKEYLRSKHRNQLTELELQALRSQMNPHFVHNSLNAILYYIQQNDAQQSEVYLSKFSTLIRRFFEYARKSSITIQDEVQLLKDYLEIEQLRFEDKLNYEVSIDPRVDIQDQFIPCMILQPLVENAVNHGIFHNANGGRVDIRFIQINPTCIKVEVEDDGIGIKRAKEINKRKSKGYQSRSSDIISKRLDILNQSKDWEVTYKVDDRSNLNKTKGTLITITFNQIDK